MESFCPTHRDGILCLRALQRVLEVLENFNDQ